MDAAYVNGYQGAFLAVDELSTELIYSSEVVIRDKV